MASTRPPTDEELLELLEAAEQASLPPAVESGEDLPDERDEGEPCAHCGEPAVRFAVCNGCGGQGCLPRDGWAPGWADPCITRCARCARHVHVDCAGLDHAGNLACPGCGGVHGDGDQ